MEKKYRVKTNINSDTVLQVNMKQDFEMMEVLTMSMTQENAYRIHSSNYGVIVGRVLANDAFGIPNAKVSIFIPKEDGEDNEIASIYPYSSKQTRDKEGRRYNILPNEGNDDCYRVVGTFPNKTYLLDNDIQLEIYDKYWKYTTVTNQAGDYMIFGVPVGTQQIHVDIDLSDIGILSQKPRDLEYKGYNITQFDNASQFKSSTNLDNLVQIFSQDKSVYVHPFWGDKENGVVAITRADVQIQYKFEPTCVFMGSVVSDNSNNSIEHRCTPNIFNGYNEQLIAGEGTIEMIRKTTDGLTEEVQIQGNRLIDSDGVFCYQIPMNLDYIGTDEYGNIVPTNNPSKGIPTRTRVRFRISKHETGDEGFSRHTAKYLVPNNPEILEGKDYTIPTVKNGTDLDKYFEFGSSTPDNCFRDMYWDKVYSVKNYIPRIQTASGNTTKHYSGIKATNIIKNHNPAPFNTLRFDLHFSYMVLCTIIAILVGIISAINTILVALIDYILIVRVPIIKVKLFDLSWLFPWGCISFGAGLAGEGNIAYYPGCNCGKSRHVACDKAKCPDSIQNCKKESDNHTMIDIIQQNLATDYEVAKMDFYNDWLNGTLYMPLWRWRKRKKKSFLFGLFHSRAKNEFCSCSTYYKRLKLSNACKLTYQFTKNDDKVSVSTLKPIEDVYSMRMHKKSDSAWLSSGVIKNVLNKDNLDIYYYTPGTPRDRVNKPNEITTPLQYVRLYATDIILLGSLNENDLHGIPQLFKYLPSTTSNIPPIATITENKIDDTKSINNDDEEDVGSYITTGMDWGYGAKKDGEVQYKKGLFMDLECQSVSSSPKSCINAERMSELGVSYDMSYRVQYGVNENTWGEFRPDGMITKMEIDDYESRAMFATLNHIGFVPNIENYVMDSNTGYYFNKLKYLYPVNFDGKMQTSMDRFVNRNSFKQGEYDNPDQSYMEFRYGSEKPSLWHFYVANSTHVSFPLYNNSFYFYFGVKAGSTALDKFNKQFFADCFSDKKYPFTSNVKFKSLSSCPTKPEDFAYIIIDVNNIAMPYSYEVYDYYGNLVGDIVEEQNDRYIGIGCEVKDDGTPIFSDKEKGNGFIQNKLIKNNLYKVKITDANGRTVTKSVRLSNDGISLVYEASGLGGRYLSSEPTSTDSDKKEKESAKINESSKNNIISNELNGSIKVSAIMIDGDEYVLTDKNNITLLKDIPDVVKKAFKVDNKSHLMCYEITVNHFTSKDNSIEKTVYLTIEPVNGSGLIGLSYKDTTSIPEPKYVSFETIDYTVDYVDKKGVNKSEKINNVLEFDFNMFYPDVYNIGLIQSCKSDYVQEIEDDDHIGYTYSMTSITIENGQTFDVLLNDVPLRTLLGRHELVTMASGYTSAFYHEDGYPMNNKFLDNSVKNLNGWIYSYDPSVYSYPSSNLEWEDYINISGNETVTNLNKVSYKLNNMFKLLHTQYFNDESLKTLSIETVGGKQPTTVRTLSPMYEDDEDLKDNGRINNYALGNIYSIVFAKSLPNIVSSNYNGAENRDDNFTGQLNPKLGGGNYSGNYIAAFTNNAGIKKSSKSKSFNSYQKIPAMSYPFNGQLRNTPVINVDTNYIVQDDKLTDSNNTHGGLAVVPGNDSKPYFRYMTLDRRMDYKYYFVTPSLFKSDGLINGSKDWQNGFICGTIYNGIVLNYDENYNIVDTKGKLEYSYGNDGHLIWNGAVGKDNKRKFYEVSINGVDKTNDETFTFTNDESFPASYPSKKEFILNDIQENDINLSFTSCSYDIKSEVDTEDNNIPIVSAITKRGEECTFKGNFANIVTPVIGSTDKDDYSILFKVPDVHGGRAGVRAQNITLSFSSSSDSESDIYPMVPFVFGAKENKNEGIYAAAKSSKTGLNGIIEYYDDMAKFALINSLDVPDFIKGIDFLDKFKNSVKQQFLTLFRDKDNKTTYFYQTHKMYLKGDGGGTPLLLTDKDILSAQFVCDYDFGNKMSTIVTPLNCIESNTNNITRSAEVYSFSEPIDTRDFEVTFVFENDETLVIRLSTKINLSLMYEKGLEFNIRYYTEEISVGEYNMPVVTAILSDYINLKYKYSKSNSGDVVLTLRMTKDVKKIAKSRPFFVYMTTPNGFVYKIYTDKLG